MAQIKNAPNGEKLALTGNENFAIDDSTDNPGTPDKFVKISATTIGALRISGSTFNTIQHIQDVFHSTGVTKGGAIIDDGDGTVTVELGTGLIRATNLNVAPIYFTDWAEESGANVALVDNDLNYLYVEYNIGAPRVIATNVKRADTHTNIAVGTVYRSGIILHVTGKSRIHVSDHAGAMIRRMHDVSPFAHKNGAKISEVGVRNVKITAGTFWHGLELYTTPEFNSFLGDTFFYYYRNGTGGWTRVAATQINNVAFDNGTGPLATLGNNNYGVHWVFMESDGEVSIVFGQASYTLSNAENAAVPAGLPPEFEDHARIVGKIIIKKSAATFTSIESAFDNIFRSAIPTSHLDLLDIGANTHAQIDAHIAANAISPTALTDGAAIAFNFNNKIFNLKTLTTVQAAITLTLSNVTQGANQVLSVVKNLAGDVTITLAGTGLSFYGYASADLGTTPVVVLSGAIGDIFDISLLAREATKIGVAIGQNGN